MVQPWRGGGCGRLIELAFSPAAPECRIPLPLVAGASAQRNRRRRPIPGGWGPPVATAPTPVSSQPSVLRSPHLPMRWGQPTPGQHARRAAALSSSRELPEARAGAGLDAPAPLQAVGVLDLAVAKVPFGAALAAHRVAAAACRRVDLPVMRADRFDGQFSAFHTPLPLSTRAWPGAPAVCAGSPRILRVATSGSQPNGALDAADRSVRQPVSETLHGVPRVGVSLMTFPPDCNIRSAERDEIRFSNAVSAAKPA